MGNKASIISKQAEKSTSHLISIQRKKAIMDYEWSHIPDRNEILDHISQLILDESINFSSIITFNYTDEDFNRYLKKLDYDREELHYPHLLHLSNILKELKEFGWLSNYYKRYLGGYEIIMPRNFIANGTWIQYVSNL